ncbi:MAG: YggS family pyridoxal phosphate-dependent enzyme [Acholeplasmataceae bacterium]
MKQVTICASKYFNPEEMRQLYHKGVTHFGENRVQDLLLKKSELSDLEITWHFIGTIQTNKVKKILPEIDVLHTLDRISLALAIQKYAKMPVSCLIQVNLTEESQKSGILLENLADFINEIKNYDKINIIGLMTIGKENDLVATEQAFKKLDELATKYNLPHRSMGMTDDYEIAQKYNATFLRIGRKFRKMLKE